ncbi:ribonuclease HII [Candidatus Woesebacteria bacterium]|nr:ribonuclease HII [Candidatus Woesebacteria bacterium]
MTKAIFPSFEFEESLWSSGYDVVAGADEVGRGSFAGPVVAAAVAFRKFSDYQFPIINEDKQKVVIRDSKTLSERQRIIAGEWIKGHSIFSNVGLASVIEINENGISAACFSAFRRAVGGMNIGTGNSVQFLLVDGYIIPEIGINNSSKQELVGAENAINHSSDQLAIKKGDQRSFSISAASIIAKLFRDDLMKKLGREKQHKVYGWASNKGYGTQQHTIAILKHGMTDHHRTQFVETFLKKHKREDI